MSPHSPSRWPSGSKSLSLQTRECGFTWAGDRHSPAQMDCSQGLPYCPEDVWPESKDFTGSYPTTSCVGPQVTSLIHGWGGWRWGALRVPGPHRHLSLRLTVPAFLGTTLSTISVTIYSVPPSEKSWDLGNSAGRTHASRISAPPPTLSQRACFTRW